MVEDRRLLCERDSSFWSVSFRLVLFADTTLSSFSEESDSEELWSKVMVVCLCTGAGRCFRGAGMFLSSEYFVDGFGRSVADRSCRRRGAEAVRVSSLVNCSVVWGCVRSCSEMCAGLASPDVGKLMVVLPFGSLAMSGNVGSSITIPVGET